MIQLILSFAMASCPTFYGKQNQDGTWSFAKSQLPGMVQVEVDQECLPEAGSHDFVGGRYVVNQSKLSSKRTSELKEKNDQKLVTKKQLNRLIQKLKEKGIDLDFDASQD